MHTIYTMHTHMMLNVVTGPVGTPHAILFRAGEPSRGLELIKARRKMTTLKRQLTTGPGVLAKALGITDKDLYGSNMLSSDNTLRLEMSSPPTPDEEIVAAKRIGLGVKSGKWTDRPWRFYRKGSLFVTPGR